MPGDRLRRFRELRSDRPRQLRLTCIAQILGAVGCEVDRFDLVRHTGERIRAH